MKVYHLLNTCLALIAGCIMFTSCSDDDDPLKGNIALSIKNMTSPEGATVTQNALTVDGKGGTFSIRLQFLPKMQHGVKLLLPAIN